MSEGNTEPVEAEAGTEEAGAAGATAPEPARTPAVDAGDIDALFTSLWNRCLEAWDDDKPHQALLDHALRNEMLPQLAGRYRSLKDDPEKGARAQKKIDGIVVAATQMLFATKTPAVTKTPWQWTASFAVACLFVLAWLTYKIFLHR
ncbi:hypothetical protein [Labilithrix luteola]|uniref:hypothetical protein n=1 Tax=Labilithrix luteola TaxID=1391654 RepID=UPI0011BA6A9B|nr:hypothetical protein [Labilithrix luteola]